MSSHTYTDQVLAEIREARRKLEDVIYRREAAEERLKAAQGEEQRLLQYPRAGDYPPAQAETRPDEKVRIPTPWGTFYAPVENIPEERLPGILQRPGAEIVTAGWRPWFEEDLSIRGIAFNLVYWLILILIAVGLVVIILKVVLPNVDPTSLVGTIGKSLSKKEV